MPKTIFISKETIKEIKILNKSGKTIGEISFLIGIGYDRLIKEMEKIGLKIKRRNWTKEEIEYLKINYGTVPNKEICERLSKRNVQSVLDKANSLGLSYGRVCWDEKMDNILIKFYPLGDWDSIYKNLPDISKTSIRNRVKRLNIKNSVRLWKEEELILLKEVYPHYTNKYLSEKYFPNRKKEDIRNIAVKMGIGKTKEKGIHWYDSENMLFQLKELSKKIDRTPLGKELVEFGLPSNKSYERYFGSYSEACRIVGIKQNSVLFGNPTTDIYSKNNEKCFSYSEKFITDFLIDKGIPYEKEKRYSDIYPEKDFGQMRMDWYLLLDGIIVEYFGMTGNKIYDKKVSNKKRLYKKYRIRVIELYGKNTTIKTLEEKIIKKL